MVFRPGEMVTSAEGKRLQERLWREIREVCERELAG